MAAMISIQPHQCLPPITEPSAPQTSKATRQELLQPHPVSSLSPMSNETKRRLGKDEVDTLEREFEQNPKPNTQTKRSFAEKLHIDLARVNVRISTDIIWVIWLILTPYRIGFKIDGPKPGSSKNKMHTKHNWHMKRNNHLRPRPPTVPLIVT